MYLLCLCTVGGASSHDFPIENTWFFFKADVWRLILDRPFSQKVYILDYTQDSHWETKS